MAFFEDSHMREPYPRDPQNSIQALISSMATVFLVQSLSNFCFK